MERRGIEFELNCVVDVGDEENAVGIGEKHRISEDDDDDEGSDMMYACKFL